MRWNQTDAVDRWRPEKLLYGEQQDYEITAYATTVHYPDAAYPAFPGGDYIERTMAPASTVVRASMPSLVSFPGETIYSARRICAHRRPPISVGRRCRPARSPTCPSVRCTSAQNTKKAQRNIHSARAFAIERGPQVPTTISSPQGKWIACPAIFPRRCGPDGLIQSTAR